MGGFICTFSLLISLPITLRTSKAQSLFSLVILLVWAKSLHLKGYENDILRFYPKCVSGSVHVHIQVDKSAFLIKSRDVTTGKIQMRTPLWWAESASHGGDRFNIYAFALVAPVDTSLKSTFEFRCLKMVPCFLNCSDLL